MYTGQWRVHKNLIRLVQAFKILLSKYHQDLDMVFIGKFDERFPELPAEVEKLKLSNRVKFTGFVEEGELPLFYNAAAAFVFPSLAEGFGLPPLEAMASGTPVVSSNVSCMPEVLGDAAYYFDPLSIQDIAKKINSVLNNPKLRQKLIADGTRQVRKYSFERMAKETLATYRDVLPK